MKPIGLFFSKSRDSLKGNWGKAALTTLCFILVIIVICFGIFVFFGNPSLMIASGIVTGKTSKIIFGIISYLITFFAIYPLGWSYATMFLSKIRGEEISIGDIFNGYSDALRITWGYILVFLCQIVLAGLLAYAVSLSISSTSVTFVSSILGYAVMLFVSILFSQYTYIIFDDGDISAFDALCKSVKLMDGHKFQYFVLLLILVVGITLLSIITLGIGLFFLIPYIATVNAHFYESLEDSEDNTEEEEGDYEEIVANS